MLCSKPVCLYRRQVFLSTYFCGFCCHLSNKLSEVWHVYVFMCCALLMWADIGCVCTMICTMSLFIYKQENRSFSQLSPWIMQMLLPWCFIKFNKQLFSPLNPRTICVYGWFPVHFIIPFIAMTGEKIRARCAWLYLDIRWWTLFSHEKFIKAETINEVLVEWLSGNTPKLVCCSISLLSGNRHSFERDRFQMSRRMGRVIWPVHTGGAKDVWQLWLYLFTEFNISWIFKIGLFF